MGANESGLSVRAAAIKIKYAKSTARAACVDAVGRTALRLPRISLDMGLLRVTLCSAERSTPYHVGYRRARHRQRDQKYAERKFHSSATNAASSRAVEVVHRANHPAGNNTGPTFILERGINTILSLYD